MSELAKAYLSYGGNGNDDLLALRRRKLLNVQRAIWYFRYGFSCGLHWGNESSGGTQCGIKNKITRNGGLHRSRLDAR